MLQTVLMPKFGQTVTDCAIIRWLKGEGDEVEKGEALLEIETDKAVIEVESFHAGTLLKVVAPEGSVVPVQTPIAFIGSPGEEIPEELLQKARDAAASQTETGGALQLSASVVPAAPDAKNATASKGSREKNGVREYRAAGTGAVETARPSNVPVEKQVKIPVSPRAARLAWSAAVSIDNVRGSGPGERVIEADVKAYIDEHSYGKLRISPAALNLARKEKVDVLSLHPMESSRITVADIERAVAERPRPLSRLRRVIADRMSQSWNEAPHFFVTVSVDVTDLEIFRKEIRVGGVRLSLLDFISLSCVYALQEHPQVNSTTDGHTVRFHSGVDLGIAVALNDGLVVPVVHDADRMDASQFHATARELVRRAQEGKLLPDEMTGSTFTVSNMGMMNVENFTAIINPGESAILAVSSMRETPVARNGKIAVRKMMKITLSSDHRIIDGVTAARFIGKIKEKMEKVEEWKNSI